MDKGYVKIYCGNGHGRTTAALGDALLCASKEKKAVIVQFLKGKYTEQTEFSDLKRKQAIMKIFRQKKKQMKNLIFAMV